MAKTAKPASNVIASNRRARRDYAILDSSEAGIVLQGSEVKSLRDGHVQIADAYARVVRGELWLDGMHIPPYPFAHGIGAHEPDRSRKLLMSREDITRLGARVAQERLSLVPLSMYWKDGRVKVDLAVARGRRREDKRQALAERDSAREMERALGRARKGM